MEPQSPTGVPRSHGGMRDYVDSISTLRYTSEPAPGLSGRGFRTANWGLWPPLNPPRLLVHAQEVLVNAAGGLVAVADGADRVALGVGDVAAGEDLGIAGLP